MISDLSVAHAPLLTGKWGGGAGGTEPSVSEAQRDKARLKLHAAACAALAAAGGDDAGAAGEN